MVILNGNDETITYERRKDKLWIKEIFHKEKLIGINVMINQDIVDTYSDDDSAKQVVKYLFNSEEEKLDIEEINFKLEVF